MRSLAILLIVCGLTLSCAFKDAHGLAETKSSSFHRMKRARMDSYWDTIIPRDARPLTKCEKERQKAQQDPAVGTYIPQCTADGSFAPMQVSGSTGYCWCVDNDGNEIPGTLTPPGREMPQCAKA